MPPLCPLACLWFEKQAQHCWDIGTLLLSVLLETLHFSPFSHNKKRKLFSNKVYTQLSDLSLETGELGTLSNSHPEQPLHELISILRTTALVWSLQLYPGQFPQLSNWSTCLHPCPLGGEPHDGITRSKMPGPDPFLRTGGSGGVRTLRTRHPAHTLPETRSPLASSSSPAKMPSERFCCRLPPIH